MLREIGRRSLNFLIGIDIAVGALLGCDRYMTISGTIGKSILQKGWASRIPWPQWWIDHCVGSDFKTEV